MAYQFICRLDINMQLLILIGWKSVLAKSLMTVIGRRRRSSINFGGKTFMPEDVLNINKMPEFCMIFARKILFFREFWGKCPCPRLLHLCQTVKYNTRLKRNLRQAAAVYYDQCADATERTDKQTRQITIPPGDGYDVITVRLSARIIDNQLLTQSASQLIK